MLLDIIVFAVIALSVYLGYKRGFVKTVAKLLCFVISIIIAKVLHPRISELVKNSFAGDFIYTKISDSAQIAIPDTMPSFIKSAGEITANSIADAVITVLTILIILIVVFIIASNIVNALNLIAKLPVISAFNRLLGLAAGLIPGLFWSYVILAFISLCNIDISWMEGSVFAYGMYKDNLLMNFIF